MKRHISNIREKAGQHKILIQNFSYLSALQVFNLLVPLITYPYLIRVLGKEIYGLIIYAQVIITYLQVIVNFGYNTFAVKEISINRKDRKKISEIVNSVFISKSILFIFSLLLFAIILTFLPKAQDHKALFILSMWACIFDVFFPVWFFQGIEKMKYFTYLSLVSRGIFLILIFFLVKKPEQYLMVPIINGTGAIISCSLALYIVYIKEKVFFFIPKFQLILNYFKKSIDFFISDVSVKIFASSNKLIVGTFLSLTDLAYYDLAEKVVTIFRNIPLNIVRSTVYPRVAKTKSISLLKNTTIIMSIYAIIAVFMINIFASSIISILGGKEMMPSLNVLRLFSIIIFTTHLSNYYITIGLWSFGYIKVFRNMMIYSSFFYLIVYFLFWYLKIINIYTITIVPIIVDIYLIFHIFIFWKKTKIK